MQEIHAWRIPTAKPASVGRYAVLDTNAANHVPKPGDAAAISQKFFQKKRLGPEDHILDSFRDGGGNFDPSADAQRGKGLVLVVDRGIDERLASFCETTAKYIRRGNDLVTRLMITALLVSEALGGSGDMNAIERRSDELTLELKDVSSGTILLGCLLADRRPGQKSAGAGTCWHRAVLFKAMCGWCGVASCSLARDELGKPVWNTVEVNEQRYVVDVMFDPGAMYEEGSARAAAYFDRVRSVGKDSSVPPSAKSEVSGKMARPPWHVEPWEVIYQRRDRAGRGGFGEVFRGTWAAQQVAVKEVKDNNPGDMEVCLFVLEISLFSGLSHPNIVRFWRGCVDLRGGSRTLLLVTEWMDQGALSELLHDAQEPIVTVAHSLVVASAVACGVEYLHDVGILHLDLKSPNVLLNSSWQVKLCDFGLAKLRENVGVHTSLRGVSPAWAPPEMFDEHMGAISEKADVYSLGIICYELFAQKLPFSELNQMQLTRAKSRGQFPQLPAGFSSDFAEFLRFVIQARPNARPNMRSVITQVHDLAKNRQLDLAQELSKMRNDGLQVGGSGKAGPKSERITRLEVEAKEVHQDLHRLRGQLQEEEQKLRFLEEQVRQTSLHPSGEGSMPSRARAFTVANTEKLAEMRFRCNMCMKLFRGENFVHKHIQERHFADVLACLDGKPETDGNPQQGNPGRGSYFDTDVAEESNTRMYTEKLADPGTAKNAKAGNATSMILQDAVREGDLQKVEHCIDQGSGLCEVDSDGNTPLHLSAQAGHAEITFLLLGRNADVEVKNDSGLFPIHVAASEGRVAACEVLLGAGARIQTPDSTKSKLPLHFASSNGHSEVCAVLLSHKANVNARDNDGLDVLHNAARFGSANLCELLLSWGAAVNSSDNDGWRALHEAARWGDAFLVDALIERVADPQAVSNDGETPLHVVPGGYADSDVVNALVSGGAIVNAADYDGETPLHVAVKTGDEDLVGIFLERGADANSRTKTGMAPLDMAKKDEIKWLLRSYKAKKNC